MDYVPIDGILDSEGELQKDAQIGPEEEAPQEKPRTPQGIDYVPACLHKGTMRLCLQADVKEAQSYKVHFQLKDMAESEIRHQLAE